jgi:hypothetical protein
MNNYKIFFTLIILFFLSINIYSQKNSKEITIRYFSKLSTNDIVTLDMINKEIFRKKSSRNNSFKLINFYTNESIDFVKKIDFNEKINVFNTSIDNLSYSNNKNLIEKLKNLNLSNLVFYKTNINTVGQADLLYKDLNELLKLIKKNKERSINIIFENDFVPYKYSVENIKFNYENFKQTNELSIIIPKIIHPTFKEQLLPDENGYIIEFDSVGCFPEYEIEINSTSEKTKGQFIKEHLKFSQNPVGSKDIFMYYTGEGKTCKIYISQTYLGKICKKMEHTEILNTSEIPNDDDCGACLNTCLYPTRFELRVRGYVSGFVKDDLWSDVVKRFSFQCPSHNY